MDHWKKCKITGKEFTSYRGFLNHLRGLGIESKVYYDLYVKVDGEGICKHCNAITTYVSGKYRSYCSKKCSQCNENKKSIISNRFNVENREEKLDLFRSRRGKVKPDTEKRNKTISAKCNALGITVSEYHREQGLKGARSVTKEAKRIATEKSMITKMERNLNGTPRSSYKAYMLFDKEIVVQGYEPIVLDYLQSVMNNGEILSGGKSFLRVPYGDSRNYYPDIFIPSKNLVIEVKSSYTMKIGIESACEKIQACLELGYSVALIVLTNNESRNRKFEGYKKALDLAISSQAPTQNIILYGEGSTTILNGVDASASKCRDAIMKKYNGI